MLATTFLFCLAGKIKTQTCKNLTTLYAVASLWIIKWLTLNQGAGAGGGKGKVCVNPLAGEHSRLVDKVEKEEKVAEEGLFDSGLKVSIDSEWLDKVEDFCWKILMVRL